MSRVVDVGGGHGRLLATILERYPRLRGKQAVEFYEAKALDVLSGRRERRNELRA